MNTDLVVFQQLKEVGIFSYLVYSLFKGYFMDGDSLQKKKKLVTEISITKL